MNSIRLAEDCLGHDAEKLNLWQPDKGGDAKDVRGERWCIFSFHKHILRAEITIEISVSRVRQLWGKRGWIWSVLGRADLRRNSEVIKRTQQKQGPTTRGWPLSHQKDYKSFLALLSSWLLEFSGEKGATLLYLAGTPTMVCRNQVPQWKQQTQKEKCNSKKQDDKHSETKTTTMTISDPAAKGVRQIDFGKKGDDKRDKSVRESEQKKAKDEKMRPDSFADLLLRHPEQEHPNQPFLLFLLLDI